jgi:macrodomain Ter protein organizer (MatP/YcbG family)
VEKKRRAPATTKTTVKVDPEVHNLLVLYSRKHELTLSSAIAKLIEECAPDILEQQASADEIAFRRMKKDTTGRVPTKLFRLSLTAVASYPF